MTHRPRSSSLSRRTAPLVPRALALVLALAAVAACSDRRASLDVSLAAPPVISPFLTHGNCPAGWTLTATLVAHNHGEDDERLTILRFEIEDGSGRTVGAESLDEASLGDRYGVDALLIRQGGSREFLVGARVDGPMSTLVLLGEVQAHDAKGVVRSRFRFNTTPVNGELPLRGTGGACPGGP